VCALSPPSHPFSPPPFNEGGGREGGGGSATHPARLACPVDGGVHPVPVKGGRVCRGHVQARVVALEVAKDPSSRGWRGSKLAQKGGSVVSLVFPPDGWGGSQGGESGRGGFLLLSLSPLTSSLPLTFRERDGRRSNPNLIGTAGVVHISVLGVKSYDYGKMN